jgi:hypothetical protein
MPKSYRSSRRAINRLSQLSQGRAGYFTFESRTIEPNSRLLRTNNPRSPQSICGTLSFHPTLRQGLLWD